MFLQTLYRTLQFPLGNDNERFVVSNGIDKNLYFGFLDRRSAHLASESTGVDNECVLVYSSARSILVTT